MQEYVEQSDYLNERVGEYAEEQEVPVYGEEVFGLGKGRNQYFVEMKQIEVKIDP